MSYLKKRWKKNPSNVFAFYPFTEYYNRFFMKVALVTGGSSGIGLATAELFMQAGMHVYAASRNIRSEIRLSANGGKIYPIRMDVNNITETKNVIERILTEYGKLDVLVCCAGNGIAGAIEDTTVDEAMYQFETCFWGMVKTINACLPVFRKQGYGQIVTVSSVAGIIPIPFQAYYSAVKAAVLSYTKALAMEIGPFGIKCCCVMPGDTKTNFTATRRYAENSKKNTSAYRERMMHAVGKMERDEQNGMQPEKIARCILRHLHRKEMPIVIIPGIDYKFYALLARTLPNKFVLWLVEKIYL